MATIITVPGADFAANPVGFMPPVASGLEAWFYVNGSADLARRNLAPGKANGVVVGTPSYEASHVRLGAGAYIESGIGQDGDCHLLVAMKVPDGTTFGSSNCFGISSYISSPTTPYLSLNAATGSLAFPAAKPYAAGAFVVSGTPTFVQANAANVADSRTWQFLTGRFLGGTGIRVRNRTAGSEASTANANAVYDGSNTFRIGAATAANGLAVDIAFAGIFSRALSDIEETAVYAAVQAYLSRRFSITV